MDRDGPLHLRPTCYLTLRPGADTPFWSDSQPAMTAFRSLCTGYDPRILAAVERPGGGAADDVQIGDLRRHLHRHAHDYLEWSQLSRAGKDAFA